MDFSAAMFAASENAYRAERLSRDLRQHRRSSSPRKSGRPGLLSRTLSLSRAVRVVKHPA